MGQAFLSPLNTDSDVLLEDKITGTTVAPCGSFPCASPSSWAPPLESKVSTYLGLPPPITRPHLIIDPILSLCINGRMLRHIHHYITEGGIPDEFLDTFHRISSPQF